MNLIEDNIEKLRQTEEKKAVMENKETCTYCYCKNNDWLLECVDCHHRFCNGISSGLPQSHIIYHLKKSEHNKIRLLKDANPLKCNFCKDENIFVLQLCKLKDLTTQKDIYIISCKTCVEKKELKDYQDLITDGLEFSGKLIYSPNEKDKANYDLCHQCTIGQIKKNEEILEELNPIACRFLIVVKQSYDNIEEYYQIYKPLIVSEKEYCSSLYEKKKIIKVNLQFYDSDPKSPPTYYFCMNKECYEIVFFAGKILHFEEDKTNNPLIFDVVIKDAVFEETKQTIYIIPINIEIKKLQNREGQYLIREKFCDIPYVRQLNALDKLYDNFKGLDNNMSNKNFYQSSSKICLSLNILFKCFFKNSIILFVK